MQYSLCDPVSKLNNDINARAKVEADLSINVIRTWTGLADEVRVSFSYSIISCYSAVIESV